MTPIYYVVPLLAIGTFSFIGYLIYLDRNSGKDNAKRYEDEERSLQAKLQFELLLSKTAIKIETFNETFYTKFFLAELRSLIRIGKSLRTSEQIADEVMKNSWKRGYFVTVEGLHIPIRLIKTAQFIQEKER